MNDDDFLPTRRSLLSRLKNWDDQESWTAFFNTYGKLLYSIALKAGLTNAEAQDVVQETAIIVARKMPGFKYDPALGSFKNWLRLITRRRIYRQLKKRLPVSQRQMSFSSAGPDYYSDDADRTSTAERLPDPRGFDLEAAWTAEWDKNLWEAALGRVKTQVKPKQFQAFDLYVIKEWPPEEVSRALGLSHANIYVTKHRVARLLKKEIKRLVQKPL